MSFSLEVKKVQSVGGYKKIKGKTNSTEHVITEKSAKRINIWTKTTRELLA
jgi:hypothetical protein